MINEFLAPVLTILNYIRFHNEDSSRRGVDLEEKKTIVEINQLLGTGWP